MWLNLTQRQLGLIFTAHEFYLICVWMRRTYRITVTGLKDEGGTFLKRRVLLDKELLVKVWHNLHIKQHAKTQRYVAQLLKHSYQ